MYHHPSTTPHGLPAIDSLADWVVLTSTMVADPENSDWRLVAVGMGGVRYGDRDIYRFKDGSSVTFTTDGLPVVYVGG